MIGAIGNGKSTVLNAIAGVPEMFETNRLLSMLPQADGKKPPGCTQEAETENASSYNTRLALTDTPGLFDPHKPLPIWLSQYGAMTSAQKKITKVLWVIQSVDQPNDQHRIARDIIRDMFNSD